MFVIRLKRKNLIIAGVMLILTITFSAAALLSDYHAESQISEPTKASETKSNSKKFIKYVEFNPTLECLEKAMNFDINSHKNDEKTKLNWIEILAYLATKYGGDFKNYKEKDMSDLLTKLRSGETIQNLTSKMKNYSYFHEAYSAVLSEYLGNIKTKVEDKEVEKYGLKVYSPIAKTFPYCDYDDFGASRSYGYSRPHLGHDMMCAVGTPVIAVESGIVEIMGWNKYGGWRIGIRSHDKKRYYYYAHLRQNRPYHCDLSEGKEVKEGDVIGYVGRTGYSEKENVNNIQTSHLHIGIELIFDESQKECDNEIWINPYNLMRLLEKNKSEVIRDSKTKEYYSVNQHKNLSNS